MNENDPRVAEIMDDNAHSIEELNRQILDLIDATVCGCISKFDPEALLSPKDEADLYDAIEAEVTRRVYTREPSLDLLPSKPSSLVIAHTADDLTRRPFLRDEDGTWFGPGPKGLAWWHCSDALIDPVPTKKTVEVQS